MENTDLLIEDALPVAEQHRRRVAGEVIGWSFFLCLQVAIVAVLNSERELTAERRIHDLSAAAASILLSWLITLAVRPLLVRWRWRELSWRPLMARIVTASLVLSLIWTMIWFGYFKWVLQEPMQPKPSVGVLLLLSWLQEGIVFLGWMGTYFFRQVFQRFNRSEIERLRLTASVKEAELRALKSQINPHFIFNALNSLRALIDEDPPRARLAVTQLSNLLRYSLQSAQAETVAFEDELRVVNDYLALEQVRHEERLRVRLDVAPDTLGLAVPPLLLQTLVENAVKYGISNRPEGGEIVVEARCEAGQLRLRVTNPGSLAPAGGAAFRGGSTGLGLKNAAERLRLFFGDRASLSLRAESASRVVAEVSMPVQLTRA